MATNYKIVLSDNLQQIQNEIILKQNITDNTLNTTSKTVVGAINENKTNIDLKVDKSVIQTAFSSTTLDTNLISEKLAKDTLDLKADDLSVLHKTGDEATTGIKTFATLKLSQDPSIVTGTPYALVMDPTTKIFKRQAFSSTSGDKFFTTSVTSNTIASSGNLTFIVDTNLAYTKFQGLIIINDPSNYMFGEVVSYNALTGELIVSITSSIGAGTFTSWSINVGGSTAGGGSTISNSFHTIDFSLLTPDIDGIRTFTILNTDLTATNNYYRSNNHNLIDIIQLPLYDISLEGKKIFIENSGSNGLYFAIDGDDKGVPAPIISESDAFVYRTIDYLNGEISIN